MGKNIEKADLNKDTTIDMLVKYLEQLDMDKIGMKEINQFEHGVKVGRVEILNMLKNICK